MKLQTEITVSSPPDVKMVSTGTQTDESYLQDSEDLENSFMKSMEEEDGHDDDIDSEWIPESDDDEQCNDYEEINPAKERKFIVFESCLEHLFTSCNSCGFVDFHVN